MAVRGVLLDLEGVLYQADALVEGAPDAVEALRGAGYRLRFLTNTTTRPRRYVCERMRDMGFGVDIDDIFSPAMAAAGFLGGAGLRRVHLAAPDGLREDFAAFTLVDEAPEALVIGDLHTGFSFERLNGLFRMAFDGARIIALHKNRYYRRAEGLTLDVGPCVAALEYASGETAEVMGKPSPAFFALALDALELEAGEVVMIGDDIEADIGGGQGAGLYAVQVETGKYSARDREHPSVVPDARIATIRDLAPLLERLSLE